MDISYLVQFVPNNCRFKLKSLAAEKHFLGKDMRFDVYYDNNLMSIALNSYCNKNISSAKGICVNKALLGIEGTYHSYIFAVICDAKVNDQF